MIVEYYGLLSVICGAKVSGVTWKIVNNEIFTLVDFGAPPEPVTPRPRDRPDAHFRFTLLEDLDGGSAAAMIRYMDGTGEFLGTVVDPDLIFELGESGSKGIAVAQGCQYHVHALQCPDDLLPSSSSVEVDPDPEEPEEPPPDFDDF